MQLMLTKLGVSDHVIICQLSVLLMVVDFLCNLMNIVAAKEKDEGAICFPHFSLNVLPFAGSEAF